MTLLGMRSKKSFDRPKISVLLPTLILLSITAACGTGISNTETITSEERDDIVTVKVEQGPNFRHKLRIMPLVTVKNPPQMAIWVETADGEFLETIYITERTARNSWRRAPGEDMGEDGINRPEALPVWSYRSFGSTIPDAIVTSTPKKGFTTTPALKQGNENDAIVVWMEVNHSTDFNEYFPKDAPENAENFSGGPWGSGQPSLLYQAILDRNEAGPCRMELIGRGSADGSDGLVYKDLSGLTSALEIIQDAVVDHRS